MNVVTNGASFMVGDNVHLYGKVVDSVDPSRLVNMVPVVMAACAGYSGDVIVGLPFVEGIKELSTGVKALMLGAHRYLLNGEQKKMSFKTIMCTTQAIGALMDWRYQDGSARKMPSEVAVMSIGFSTVELMVVTSKNQLNYDLSTSQPIGVRTMLDRVEHASMYSMSELDAQLRNGSLKAPESIVDSYWQGISGLIDRTWGRAKTRFPVMIAVGGGVHVVGRHRLGPGWVIPDDPVGSIARGLYKLGQAQKH
jgi:hypothetical protein